MVIRRTSKQEKNKIEVWWITDLRREICYHRFYNPYKQVSKILVSLWW